MYHLSAAVAKKKWELSVNPYGWERLIECHAWWTGIQANGAWSLNTWMAVALDGMHLCEPPLFQPWQLFTFCHLTIHSLRKTIP